MVVKKAFIFAGTNGAGKTTLYFNELEVAKDFGFRINVDEIVSAFGNSKNTQDQIRASKIALKMRKNYIKQGKDFNQESTLCGNSILSLFHQLKKEDYQIHLFYIGLDNAQIAKERVKIRVLKGGHNVAENLIEKRYDESLKNLMKIAHLCDKIVVFDNTYDYKKLLELNFDKLSVFNEVTWVLEILNHLKSIAKDRQNLKSKINTKEETHHQKLSDLIKQAEEAQNEADERVKERENSNSNDEKNTQNNMAYKLRRR